MVVGLLLKYCAGCCFGRGEMMEEVVGLATGGVDLHSKGVGLRGRVGLSVWEVESYVVMRY